MSNKINRSVNDWHYIRESCGSPDSLSYSGTFAFDYAHDYDHNYEISIRIRSGLPHKIVSGLLALQSVHHSGPQFGRTHRCFEERERWACQILVFNVWCDSKEPKSHLNFGSVRNPIQTVILRIKNPQNHIQRKHFRRQVNLESTLIEFRREKAAGNSNEIRTATS